MLRKPALYILWLIHPGFTSSTHATCFGVIAAYRDLDNAVWRASVETPIDETIEVTISIDRLSVKINHKE